MLDLKTVKNITISEGSVTKITNSSGVVLWQKQTGSSASLDVDLNNQWVESNKTLSGYKVYMSNSNYNVDNGYASMKFKFKGMPDFKLWINSYAESNYDYTVAWNLDVNYPTSLPSWTDDGAKAHTSGKQYDPANGLTAYTEVDYPNDGGEHFVVVTYRKDSSVDNNDDRGYVAVKLTPTSTTYVLSTTEFVKKDDKYYQRLNEVGTYVDGSTGLTGNYKEGNELTVTYHQGTADDYIITDGKMYYKKYAYVTPVNTEINTGDYIQGDYIGEATPSMKVTYTDNSEKTFYELSTIDRNTDANKANAKNVVIYDSVTSIGDFAFYQCSSLTSITISDSVTSISRGTFYECSSLTSFTIPNSVTSIGDLAFYKCSNLTSVTIQNSTSKLACSSITFGEIPPNAKLYVPSNLLADYQSDSNWTGAFGGGIFAIGERVITNAMKVEYGYGYSDIFTGLTSIDENIIDDEEDRGYVDYVTIYYGVTSIGDYAFKDFISLMDVRSISYSVKTIGKGAFWGCSGLYDITLPYYVTNIGDWAFSGCSHLNYITVQASTPPTLGTDAIPSNVTTIYVPASSVNRYKSATNWSAYASKIKAIGT